MQKGYTIYGRQHGWFRISHGWLRGVVLLPASLLVVDYLLKDRSRCILWKKSVKRTLLRLSLLVLFGTVHLSGYTE
jgi:hypothetical protein